jgi:aspartate racemase
MQTLGVVGGIAPGSTIDYYRLLIDGYRARRVDGGQPLILINSIDLQYFLGMVGGGDRARLATYLVEEVARLARAGADFGLFASNTPHLVFDEVRRQSPIPLISIVETAARASAALGLKHVGLLGTRFTMEGGFYQRVFEAQGIAVTTPEVEDRNYIHERYMGELVGGIFTEATRAGMQAVIDRMRASAGVEAVVLGGTELPLLFRDGPASAIPLLDTTRLHVDAALDRLLGSHEGSTQTEAPPE